MVRQGRIVRLVLAGCFVLLLGACDEDVKSSTLGAGDAPDVTTAVSEPSTTTTVAPAVATTAAPTTTAAPAQTTTTARRVRVTTTTAAPAPAAVAPASSGSCHPSYQGTCIPPDVSDADCYPGSGDGPWYVKEDNVKVVGPDVFDLDRDGDGIGCEA
jgi:hypothetical protein